MFLKKTLGLAVAMMVSGNAYCDDVIYNNVHISNIYSGNYITTSGNITQAFCVSFADTKGTQIVSTCEISGWGDTLTELKFMDKSSLLKQFYLTGETIWVKTGTAWTDPQIKKISDKRIISIGTSNGWEFGNN